MFALEDILLPQFSFYSKPGSPSILRQAQDERTEDGVKQAQDERGLEVFLPVRPEPVEGSERRIKGED